MDGEHLVLYLLEEPAGVPGQLGQLAHGPGESVVADSGQLFKRSGPLSRAMASQDQRLADALGERHGAPSLPPSLSL